MDNCNEHNRPASHYYHENGRFILLCDDCLDELFEEYFKGFDGFRRALAKEEMLRYYGIKPTKDGEEL